MDEIEEILLEPSSIYTDFKFKLKIRMKIKKYILTQGDNQILTEDGKKIITEWSEN